MAIRNSEITSSNEPLSILVDLANDLVLYRVLSRQIRHGARPFIDLAEILLCLVEFLLDLVNILLEPRKVC